MKHLIFTLALLSLIAFSGRGQNNVGINDNNSAPKASAMLDIYSTTKGMLIPRIALTSTTTAAPVTTPETSLLIYNTATTGDVTPGYYYWNGTKWVRLVANADPAKNYITVTKSGNAALLKTENMVLASGNITLTLPGITSADNGLAITIKNTGTYTDLITITGNSGATIDLQANATLTRWEGTTFIAYGSNWLIKDKKALEDNVLAVCETGSFTTIAEVVAFLNIHMSGATVVELGESNQVAATQTINLPYPVTFKGISYGETTIEAAAGLSGSPMFTCATECYFKMIMFTSTFNGPGNDALRLTGIDTYYEVKDCYIAGFNKGIVTTSNTDLWIFENDIDDCAAAGLEIAAGSSTKGRMRISETDFTNCAKGINLLSGVSETISILNCGFYNTTAGTDIGIFYAPATFTTIASMFISNNTWNNQGTFISGFDFSRSDGRDANVFLTNNAGMESENPHVKMNVNNNNTTTTINTANTYYKANWTNAPTGYTCKFTVANNRITYQPNHGGDVWAIITGNLSVNNSNRVITIAMVKNGVTSSRYGETDLRITTSNQPFQFSTVVYIPDMKKNDYLEVFVTSNISGDQVKFQDIQWFSNTQ